MAFEMRPVSVDEVKRGVAPDSPYAEALRRFLASDHEAVEVDVTGASSVRSAAAMFCAYARRMEVREQVKVVQRAGHVFLLRK